METLRSKIKTLAENQSSLKNQRKTVRFVGTRTIDAADAPWRAEAQSRKLRRMYVALGLRRGLEYSQIESNPKIPFTEYQINKIVEEWKDYM